MALNSLFCADVPLSNYLHTWRSGNSVGHFNKVMLRRARLVLAGLPAGIFRVTQPGHPSVGMCNEYRLVVWPPLGKKRRVPRSSRPHSLSQRMSSLATDVSLRKIFFFIKGLTDYKNATSGLRQY